MVRSKTIHPAMAAAFAAAIAASAALAANFQLETFINGLDTDKDGKLDCPI